MLAFEEIRKIHFIGICGASLRVLAMLCVDMGLQVSGSDVRSCNEMQILRQSGVDCYSGHDLSKIKGVSLVVYSAAVSKNDEELSFAISSGVPCIERKEFLPMIAGQFDKVVSIAGSHGKTTTSLMTERILRELKCKFAAHIGGQASDGGDLPTDTGREIFLSEACEYRRSFLSFSSDVGVITSIDYDHPDTYSDAEQYSLAFEQYRQKCRVCVVSEDAKAKLKSTDNVIVCGYDSSCDYFATNLTQDKGKFSYVVNHGQEKMPVRLNVIGRHNVVNSMLAIAVCAQLGYPLKDICRALSGFVGVKRRFECKGKTANGARVIVDYAHHPTEIKAAIDAALLMTHGRIWVVFQPHTYSRTASLLDGFVDSFYWCDELIIAPTYSARESREEGADAFDLYCALVEHGKLACYIEDDKKIADVVAKSAGENDIILILGAGDIYSIAQLIVQH
ncbi:MAG: UDP-N-acetylmuramate--L-alanine ligase [Christensenellales bacterium]